jgi:hypothetical protein
MFSKSKPLNPPAPILKLKHLANCKFLPQRFNLLAKLPKGAIGAEIGVLGGDWSDKLIRFTKPKELVLIDTFCSSDYIHLKRFTKKNHFSYIKDKFKSVEGVSFKQGLSWNCMAEYKDNYFDWIYVDAAHNYDAVKKDLNQVKRVLKDYGIIIMNDYIMHDHFMKDDYGVVAATNEFLIENDFEMLYFALHPNMFCDVMIKKIER